MKSKSVFIVLFLVVLAACTSTIMSTPTSTTAQLPTSASILPVFTTTPRWWIVLNTTETPEITATPMNLLLNEKDELLSLLQKMYPNLCMWDNLAVLTPPPQNKPTPPKLKFTEVDPPPNPQSHYIREIADNIDNSFQAYIACELERCVDNVYVKDNKTGKVYEVYFGANISVAIQGLIWINKDTFIVNQLASAEPVKVRLVAINVNEREYAYYGLDSQCPTPIP